MRSSVTIVALAALGVGQVLASPTHAHLHKNAHEKKDVASGLQNVDWNAINWSKLNVDWKNIDYSGGQASSNAVAATASAPTSAAAAASSVVASSAASVSVASTSSAVSSASSAASSSSSSGSLASGLFDNLFNGVVGVSNNRKSFGGRVAATGSIVSYTANSGSPYGSNVMLVDSVGSYLYTITWINTSPNAMTINIWNKQGMDGQPNSGCTDATKKTTLTFNLAPGASAIVAADEGSVLGATQASNQVTSYGAFATTWAEFKFVDHDCGYDVSKILNSGPDYQMSISSQECSCVSSNTQNNWITETQTTGSGSCYVNVGGAHLTVKMGGPVS